MSPFPARFEVLLLVPICRNQEVEKLSPMYLQHLSKHKILYVLDGFQEQEKACNCYSFKDLQER